MALDFGRTARGEPYIPSASMGDIVFLLLIFFMVTTVFREAVGLPVDLPRAEAGEEGEKEMISSIFIDRLGRISVDDRLVQVRHIPDIFGAKLADNPQLIVAFKTDAHTPYEVVSEVMEQLKEVNAVRVFFNNDIEVNPGTKY
ncbi:MAG TPA: biopolymer transporter ExbD [Candidatus Krumholzibacteria bacterium]|nr:biopolymer transporter ExbD [Candidatus Krumholzibacteria bacterium]HPD71349.1 biopolymer transporter ExbD [Candidatus Krumholzibacteria bacterium]HRY38951.1 biopolymer transporter ExbD [Candidatus Krumholzibacteria bacterium]